MKTTRLPIAAALAVAISTMLPAAESGAAALGEIVSLSPIGEPLRVEIGVTSGNAEELAACLRVVVPESAQRELSWLKNGRIVGSGSGASARIVVSHGQPVTEPAIRLALANICDAQMRKEFTLLLPYPASAPLPAAAAAGEPPGMPAAVGAPRARTASRATWSTAPGESLASLAEALYPDDAAARRRFTQATAAANPGLFPDPASRSAELPPGTEVRIPDLRRLASASREGAARAPQPRPAQAGPAPGATPAPAARAATGDDRVVVAPDTPAADDPSTRTAAGISAPRRGVAADAGQRERELVEAIDRSIVAEMELLARIKELERLQAQLEEQAHALVATQPPAMPVSAAPAEPPPAEAPPARSWRDWLLGGGLLLAVLLILAALLRRRRTGDEAASNPPPATHAPNWAVRDDVAARMSPPLPSDPLDDAHRHIAWEPAVHETATPRPAGADTEHDPSDDHKSAVELADIMMSFGRLQGAAETLAEFIQGNPRQAITPWLKLLDVYRAAGLRSEFEELSRQLNKTFNVRRVSWDNYDSLRVTALSLESMPHITTRLQALWGSRECQAYIQQLLRDNRDGSRQGLPFSVIDELLLLEGVLEQELGPFRTYSMKVATDPGQ